MVVAGKSQPLSKTYLEQYASAQSREERRFAAVFTILHFPGMRPYVDSPPRTTAFSKIDNYRENWWCSDVGSIVDSGNAEKDTLSDIQLNQLSRQMVLPSPPFLSPDQARDAQSELKQLQKIGAAADYLPATVLQWVKAHPDDPRHPRRFTLLFGPLATDAITLRKATPNQLKAIVGKPFNCCIRSTKIRHGPKKRRIGSDKTGLSREMDQEFFCEV